MKIEAFFHKDSSTISYIVADMATRLCAVIDSVLDFDQKAGRTSTLSADGLIARIRELELKLAWILETHVHADHISAAPYLKRTLGGHTGVGSKITEVQHTFGSLFNAGHPFSADGRQFDQLLADAEVLQIGSMCIEVLHTPGHTAACVTYVARDGDQTAAFVGDTMFMPDSGSARCDFPGGDARTLYRSIRRVLALPKDTELYMCHDYQPNGRALAYRSSVGQMRAENIHIKDGITEADFVEMRNQRDAILEVPALLFPAVQVNMRAGNLPPPEANGKRYLKTPLNTF